MKKLLNTLCTTAALAFSLPAFAGDADDCTSTVTRSLRKRRSTDVQSSVSRC